MLILPRTTHRSPAPAARSSQLPHCACGGESATRIASGCSAGCCSAPPVSWGAPTPWRPTWLPVIFHRFYRLYLISRRVIAINFLWPEKINSLDWWCALCRPEYQSGWWWVGIFETLTTGHIPLAGSQIFFNIYLGARKDLIVLILKKSFHL